MRDNFEELVERLLSGEEDANKTFYELLSESFGNYAVKLTDDEIEYLKSETEKKEPNNVTYYVQGCLCYIRKEYSEAIVFYEQAIAHGNAYAMNIRAFMHKVGRGGNINYPEAIRLFEQAIDLKNAYAMCNRAVMHYYGQGAEINYLEAARLFEESASLGYSVAMNNRGFMHKMGQGGEMNYSEAIIFFQEAIARGQVHAMHNRASMHEKGQGGEVNNPEAAKLYRQAVLIRSLESPYINRLKRLKQSFPKSSINYHVVAYHFAAAENTLPHCLKTHPERISIFAEDTLLTLDEKNAIMATFRLSFILKNIDKFPESLISATEKDLIHTLDNNKKQLLSEFLTACSSSGCFNPESPQNFLLLTFVLDHIMRNFKPQIAEDRSLAWFVTSLLSRLGKRDIDSDHFKSLIQLRADFRNKEDGRLFAIFLAYAECLYPICQESSIHALNHQPRSTFSRSATTGQHVDAWIGKDENTEKRKTFDTKLDFFNSPSNEQENDEIMAWMTGYSDFGILLEPANGIQDRITTARDSMVGMIRNSIYASKKQSAESENIADAYVEKSGGISNSML